MHSSEEKDVNEIDKISVWNELMQKVDSGTFEAVKTSVLYEILNLDLTIPEAGKAFAEYLATEHSIEWKVANTYLNDNELISNLTSMLDSIVPAEDWLSGEVPVEKILYFYFYCKVSLRASKCRYKNCNLEWKTDDAILKALKNAKIESEKHL